MEEKYEQTSAADYENDNTGSVHQHNLSAWQRFVDSYKPARFDDDIYEGMTPVEKAAHATSNSPLSKQLKGRHVQMIALGGSIGTGLFIGLGDAISQGGPGSTLISFAVVGSFIYVTIGSLAELSAAFNAAGAFAAFANRFVDPAFAFAVGTNYALQWLAALPLELLSASICAQYWNQALNPASIVIIFWLFIAFICLGGGAKWWGEAEFWLSLIKVIAVVGFIIMGICVTCGASPNGQGYIGGKYWHDPGSFMNGFKGFAATFVSSSFSFSGTELVGIAAAEMKNPRRDLPRATKQVFLRILLFYILSVIVVGCLVPSTDPQLIGSGAAVDVNASPFVIAIQNAGIKVLPHIFNAVVLIALLSVANSSVYGASRTIASLAAMGQLPKWMGYIDRKGRPMAGILITLVFGLLCFVVAAGQDVQNEVFDWLMAISGLSALFTWGTCCFCQLRFRQALKAQGRDTREIPFKSPTGTIGAVYGIFMMVFILGLQFWIALFPLGGDPSAQDFFKVYLAFPLALVCWIGYKLIYKTKYINANQIDIDTGRRVVDVDALQEEIEREKAAIRARPFWYRAYRFVN